MLYRRVSRIGFPAGAAAICLIVGTLFSAAQELEGLPPKTFKNVKVIPHTPVKSQGSTGACWSYCTISLLESELMRQGRGEYELSEMFPVYHCYIERADYYVRAHGNNNFSQGGIDNDVLWTIRKFGIVRDSDYSGLWPYESGHNHSELSRALKAYLDAVIASNRSGPSPKWPSGFKAVLDAYLGPAPTTIDVDGKQVTPKQFADEILGINLDDYVGVTSFTHMPFYAQVELLAPDNWKHHSDFYNAPLDELMAIIDYALENGLTVSIGSDVSEETFSGKAGYAIWHEDGEVTPEEREAMWAAWSTEDDHGMHIVGLAQDEAGKPFYYTKNSWGNSGPFQGYVYLSKNFVRAKVNSITVHKDAVPESIRAKLGIK